MSALPESLRLWLSLVSWWVPAEDRARWREEWEAELWQLRREPGSGGALVARAAGALPHALWLRWQSLVVEMLGCDLRAAWRGLARRPAFFLLASSTLALGLGGVFALLALFRAVFLSPLPVPEPDRLVWHWGTLPASDRASVSPPDFLDYRAGAAAYGGFAAMTSSAEAVTVTGDPEPQRLRGRMMTADLLEVLGLDPLLGRPFTEDETRGAEPEVVLLSEGLWRSRFGARRDVLDRDLHVGGRSLVIVGVVPAALAEIPGGAVDLWLPATFGAEGWKVRRYHFLRPIGRLRDGATLGEAREQLERIAVRLEADHPDSNSGWRIRAQPLAEVATGPVRPVMTMLLAAVGAVLLIACVNVAGLLLAAAPVRRAEMGLRAALGASRKRLLQLLLGEAVLLAISASVLAFALAHLLVRFAQRSAASSLPGVERADEILSSPGFVGFGLALCLLVGVGFGVAPALRLVGSGLAAGRRIVGDRERSDLRRRLVALEVGASFVLLCGALLFARSLHATRLVDPGFSREGTLVLPLDLQLEGAPAAAPEILRTVAASPGVESAALTTVVPMWASRGDTYVHEAGVAPGPGGPGTALVAAVTGDYFRTLGISLLRGRTFAPDEPDGVVIVNRAFARWMFGEADPLGRRVVVDGGPAGSGEGLEVVGVVGDVRQFGPRVESQPEFYLPFDPVQIRDAHLVVRTPADPAAHLAPIRATVRSIDPGQPLEPARTLEAIAAGSLEMPLFQARLVGLLATLAVALAVVGLYGLLASLVADRRRELAVRMALGADRRAVGRLMARQLLRAVGPGVVLGGVGTWVSTRFAAGLVYGVEPLDPWSVGGAGLLLAAGAVVAAWLPLQRALKVDPAHALRAE